MRTLCRLILNVALLAPLSLVSASIAQAEEDFPYTARITGGEVYVRSGPGKDYYPTEKLIKGNKVEVYRHDPGGWCAIRPPEGSFSWVAAKHLELTSDGLAKSKGDRVVARVGSSFSDIRDVIQVRLKKGESIELAEEPTTEEMQWYRIHPPAGEFRWISSRFLEPIDPKRARRMVQVEADEDGDEEVDLSEDREPRRLSARLLADEGIDDRSFEGGISRRNREIELASGQEPERDDTTWKKRQRLNAADHRAGEPLYPLAKEIDSIDLELSTIVAEEITVWSFDRVKQRAERALDVAQTAVDRGRVRAVITKIERFDELKRRHDTTSARAETERRDAALSANSGSAASTRTDTAPLFDGTGRLTPVVSTKVGAPQYALVDERGAVSVFLSAAPGVNLRSYVDKQIGVNGPRGFIPDLQKQHINVQRVTKLDATVR